MTDEEFIGEAIKPDADTFNAHSLIGGEPAMPRLFTWRGEQFVVAEVLEKWKTAGDCRSGSTEQYVRKHWFRIRTSSGDEMKVYFERQPRSGRERKTRWWLYSMKSA
jgi:hypothetical protein